jgi:hypothetical protein
MALDQPIVVIEVIDPNAAGGPKSLGPDIINECLLDTGTSGFLVTGDAVSSLDDAGFQTVAQYQEQGVAGFDMFNVSALYELDFAGTSGVRQTFADARLLAGGNVDLGDWAGIVGMPGMRGKIAAMDFSVWQSGEADTLGLEFPATLPASSGHRYTLPLVFVNFPPDGQQNPTDPLPSWSDLPMIEVTMRSGDKVVTGRYVFDTGAQLSVISTKTAFALGLDKNGDGNLTDDEVDSLDVGGIGGTVTVPILNAGTLVATTSEGVDLAWSGMQMAAFDIDPQIDGVFGMDLLTNGWIAAISGGTPGAIEQTYLDFSNDAAPKVVVDLNPTFDKPTSAAPARHAPAARPGVHVDRHRKPVRLGGILARVRR